MEFLKHYALVGIIFVAIDAFWLTIVANKFYKKEMSGLLRDKPSMLPAVVFYFIYIAAIVFFALHGATSFWQAAGKGALLGLAMYATYDLTNASTLKGWSKKVTVVDLLWGTFVTAVTTAVAFLFI